MPNYQVPRLVAAFAMMGSILPPLPLFVLHVTQSVRHVPVRILRIAYLAAMRWRLFLEEFAAAQLLATFPILPRSNALSVQGLVKVAMEPPQTTALYALQMLLLMALMHVCATVLFTLVLLRLTVNRVPISV